MKIINFKDKFVFQKPTSKNSTTNDKTPKILNSAKFQKTEQIIKSNKLKNKREHVSKASMSKHAPNAIKNSTLLSFNGDIDE